MTFKDFSKEEIDSVMREAWEAFHVYRKLSLKARADFMRSIAVELENGGDASIEIAMKETHLPEARLRGERARTIFQLNQYAAACESGEWLEARIDTAIPEKNPPKPDIRKMLVPLGPVVVFGASNFPFAYSTAGGDTACALAAGCSVIVKAHPAHPHTSHRAADAIAKAALQHRLPKGIFAHIYGQHFEVGEALVKHHYTKAVAFTGSYNGGKQLFDWANQREEPIPVFAEMGSVNPIFLLPEKMKIAAAEIASMVAASITLGAGQFCTNPGLLIGIEGEELKTFAQHVSEAIHQSKPAAMLHTGIAKAYHEKREKALRQSGVHVVAKSAIPEKEDEGAPAIATTSGEVFLKNPSLKQEVFGPYSLLVQCKDRSEMETVAKSLEGQLTSTLMATENDIKMFDELVEAVKNCCGRLILNAVPTGVEVCLSMHHGGPFPATTDSRFTSVGADGIKRFARPMAFQNWSDKLLPDELKNKNPLTIWRTINNELSKSAVEKMPTDSMAKKPPFVNRLSGRVFHCIDAHTCGNPVRLIVEGGPSLEGKNMSEKRQYFLKEYDWIRKGLMFEPRGHDMMSGSILYPPHDPQNDVAVLFIETSGCLPMCGHGTIGTITIAIEEGLIIPKTAGIVRMETPAGLVMTEYKIASGSTKVQSVKLTNVPSFLHSTELTVNCPELGELTIDVSYGGNFYAIVDVQKNFKGLEHYPADKLISWAREIRKNSTAKYEFIHPQDATINGCHHVLWTGAPLDKNSTARNAVFYGDKAIDRSPCGTGTSARMAQWYAKGKLKKGDNFIHESIIGSKFVGRIEEELELSGRKAIRPSIEGWARILGYNTISIDKDDPYAYGFQVV